MRAFLAIIILSVISSTRLFAQSNEPMLAKQFNDNNEPQKALEYIQKLYKLNNEANYDYYINTLLSLKKFDEAESATKKLANKHPDDLQYPAMLCNIYTQQGNLSKADDTFNVLLKKLPPDKNAILNLAMLFYRMSNVDYAAKILLQGRKSMHDNTDFAFELINLYRAKRDKPALTTEYLNLLPHNPELIMQAENTFANVYEGNADYDMLRTDLLHLLQKDPQQTAYAQLLTWQYLQQKEYDLALNQALALSRRENDGGSSIFNLCRTLTANEAYDAAIRGYEFIVAIGNTSQYYILAKIGLISTKDQKITSGKYLQTDLLDLEKEYIDLLAELGRNNRTAFAMQRLAKLQAFKLHKLNDAQKLLQDATNIPNLEPALLADCKLDLGDVYLMNKQPWEATLLYSQVEKDFPNTDIGQDAKFKNAKLAYYTGDFTWAKGQLDVLKAATSQLIANDALNLSLLIADNTVTDSAGNALKIYARADLQIFAESPDKAMLTLDSIDAKFPANSLTDDILMSKSRIMIQEKEYASAVPLLKKIAEEHSAVLWADDAVFMLGDIYENHLDDKTTAKTYYQKIITDYPGSLWINEARKRFRLLRGDKTDS